MKLDNQVSVKQLEKVLSEGMIDHQSHFDDTDLDMKVQLVMWISPTWLHQRQLYDDYVMYTIVREMLADEELEIAFDI